MVARPARTAPDMAESYFTPAEVAVRLGVSLRTIRSMIAAHELRAVRFGPRSVRIPADALAEAIRPYSGGDAAA